MFRFLVLYCVIAFVSGGSRPSKTVKRVAELQPQASGHASITVGYGEHSAYAEEYAHNSGPGNSGKYVSSSELTSLAHNSALQAKAIAQNQQTAGSQAAFGAQINLAQAAVGAANTAQAALVGKQVIVQNLEHQLHDAEKQLQAEIAQYHQTQQVAKAAQEAAYQAQQQLNALTAALTSIQGGAQQAQQAASEAAGAAAAQHAMIQEAKQRVAYLSQKLHNALSELQSTEVSAHKAAAAAQQAQTNAAAAAGAVALSSSHSDEHEGYHH